MMYKTSWLLSGAFVPYVRFFCRKYRHLGSG
jgi:hypothetical protein